MADVWVVILKTGEIMGPYPQSYFEYYDGWIHEAEKGKTFASGEKYKVRKKKHVYKNEDEYVIVVESALTRFDIWEDVYAPDFKINAPPIKRRQKFKVDLKHLRKAERVAYDFEIEGTEEDGKKVRAKHTNAVARYDLKEVTE